MVYWKGARQAWQKNLTRTFHHTFYKTIFAVTAFGWSSQITFT